MWEVLVAVLETAEQMQCDKEYTTGKHVLVANDSPIFYFAMLVGLALS